MTDLFFVYGTLKIGGRFAEMFNKKREFSKRATLKGFNLYNLGAYPAIIEGEGEVKGELHSYSDPKNIKNKFDYIEGYRPENEKYSHYLRRKVKVTLENGEEKEAYVYIFNGKIPDECEKIDHWEI